MGEEIRKKFENSPARIQKQFIDKAFSTDIESVMDKPITSVPYIDIKDEGEASIRKEPLQEMNLRSQKSLESTNLATERIRSAVKNAFTAGKPIMERKPSQQQRRTRSSHSISASSQNTSEVRELRNEISYLRNMLEKFQKVPQSFLTMHPGAEEGIPYELSATYEKLQRAGISHENIIIILKQCIQRLEPKQLRKKSFVDAFIAKHFLDEIKVVENRTNARFHTFIGSSGQGKTSSLVKLASHMVICEKKDIAILTTDYAKVGAAEQLRIYAQILNVPFAVIRRRSDWNVIQNKLGHISHFLVDFPGMNLRSIGELDFIRNLMPPNEFDQCTHYVQSVLAKDTDAFEIAGRYMTLGFSDVIFTCLDESTQHGLIYNFQKKFGVPLHSFGIGPKVPEDMEAATKERVIDLIFKLTKIRKS